MMPVGVGCYCSCLLSQVEIAEKTSGEGRREVRLWSHDLSIVVAALSGRRPIAFVPARGLESEERCRSIRIASVEVPVCRF